MNKRMSDPILTLENLRVVFDTPFGESHALRGIDLAINRGEIFGIVGESGCGKSMTAQAILDIVPHPGRVAAGRMTFDGKATSEMSDKEKRVLRGKRINIVYQNPKNAINPVFRVGEQLAWIMRYNGITKNKAEIRERSLDLLTDVGLPRDEYFLKVYPHQLSGGQQQRVMIAFGLATEPELLIADEPTTALDVTLQAQILDLLKKLQEDRNLTIMLITHDMGVVAETCREMAVFYAGQVVEKGHVRDIFHNPQHPYTQGLLSTLPQAGSRGKDLVVIEGAVPSGTTLIAGCGFASRCPKRMEICDQQRPSMTFFSDKNDGIRHEAACFLYERKV